MQDLIEKIRRREARCGVIGLGYVGLPLALEFARAGFRVTGIDLDERKVDAIAAGRSYIVDTKRRGDPRAGRGRALPGDQRVLRHRGARHDQHLRADAAPEDQGSGSHVRGLGRERDQAATSGAVSSSSSRARRIPGTTDEVVRPALEAGGLEAGEDFALAFSPERIDPGNKQYNTKNIPKVVGGHSAGCTAAAKALYEQSVDTVDRRLVDAGRRDGEAPREHVPERQHRPRERDRHDVRRARHQRLGGHRRRQDEAASASCRSIPGRASAGTASRSIPSTSRGRRKMNGFDARFIELAGAINEGMPRYVVEKITDALNRSRKSIRGSRIHVLGVAYKAGVNDIRESPALIVMRILAEKGAVLSYSDPYIPAIREEGFHARLDRARERASRRRRLRRDPHRPQGDRLRSGREDGTARRRYAQRPQGPHGGASCASDRRTS